MNQQKTREAIMKAGRRERRQARLLGRICRNVRRKCARSSASSPMHYASVRVSSGPTSTRVRLGSVPVAYAPPPRQDSSRCSNPCSRETPRPPGTRQRRERRKVELFLFIFSVAALHLLYMSAVYLRYKRRAESLPHPHYAFADACLRVAIWKRFVRMEEEWPHQERDPEFNLYWCFHKRRGT